MSGICSYLPTQSLVDWCAGIDFTGTRVAIGLTIIGLIAYAKLEAYLAPKDDIPLTGRVHYPDQSELIEGAEMLSSFLKDGITKESAESFIAEPPSRPLWELLLRATFNTVIQSQLKDFGTCNPTLIKLSDKIAQGPTAWMRGYKKLQAETKALILKTLLQQVKKLKACLKSSDILPSARLSFPPELVQQLSTFLKTNDPIVLPVQQAPVAGKGKEESD